MGVRSTEARAKPTWAMLWTSVASASRTPEKVWLRSAGTSVRSFPSGLRRQAEGDPRLVDLLEGLLDRGFGRPPASRRWSNSSVLIAPRWRGAASARLRSASAQLEGRLLAPQGRHAGPQHGDLVIDVLDRRLELPPLAPGLGQDAADLGLGGHQVGLGADHGRLLDVELNLVRLPVELDQQVPLLHAVVVVDQDPAHLAGDPGGHEGHVAVDVGVIGGDRLQHRLDGRGQGVTPDRQADHGPRPRSTPSSRGATAPRPQAEDAAEGGSVAGLRPRGPDGRLHRPAADLDVPRLRRRGPGRSRPCLDCGVRMLVNRASHVDVPLSVGRWREEPVTPDARGRAPGVWVISATTAFVRQSAATNSAPWRCMAARQALPAASMKVTPVRSTRRTGLRWRAKVLCQHSSSSRTHGPASLPSSWNVTACGVVVDCDSQHRSPLGTGRSDRGW